MRAHFICVSRVRDLHACMDGGGPRSTRTRHGSAVDGRDILWSELACPVWVQLYMHAALRGCSSAWVQLYLGAALHACSSAWVQLCVGSAPLEWSSTWLLLHMVAAPHGCCSTWLLLHMVAGPHGCCSTWLLVHAGAGLHGCPALQIGLCQCAIRPAQQNGFPQH